MMLRPALHPDHFSVVYFLVCVYMLPVFDDENDEHETRADDDTENNADQHRHCHA